MSEENTGLTTTQRNQIAMLEDADARKQWLYELEQFTKNLNAPPNPAKIKKYQGYEYLPISNVEKDLDRLFFGLVQYEVLSYQQIFNEICTHARIKVFHPIIKQWMNYDGLGSCIIQQDAETKVIDFHLYKKPNALKLALPNSYAEAIKNGAKKIGKRFGSDINRKVEDVAEYEPFIKEKPLDAAGKKHKKEVERVTHLINDAQTMDELLNVHPYILEEHWELYDEKLESLKPAF